MGITSYDAQVERALWIKAKNLWIAIGRTTAWPTEQIPPSETPGTHDIDEPVAYHRPSVLSLARPVSSGGDVTFNGQQYAFVADVDAYTEYARFIYFKAVFDPIEDPGLPLTGFRQSCVYSGLVPAAGHESDQWLAPANVSDPGILEYIANHTLVSGPSAEIEIVLECR